MEPFIGEIKIFAGNFAPRGYAFCDGQLLPIVQYTALFSILGTTYGGNGQTNFGLPDLRGRVPIHQGNGIGLTPRLLGEMSGQETVTLTSSQIPNHTHAVSLTAVAAPADSVSPNGNYIAQPVSSTVIKGFSSSNPGATVNLAQINSQAVGGSQPHNNMQPYSCVNFIIALEGIFPSRN